MNSSLLRYLKSGPPAPRVILLPDQRFFVRSLAVADAATAAEVSAQVELALETLSPFPPAQLYYGYYWVPGSTHALVFAAYRKRFTAEQTAEWAGAELIAPASAAVFSVAHKPATTLLMPSADGLTAIYWEDGAVPSLVLTRSLAADATDADRAQARDELLAAAGGTRAVIDLATSPEIAASPDDQALLFRAGEFTASLAMAAVPALDVRDKGELAALHRAQARDLLLWRIFAGSAIALVLLFLAELALVGIGRPWQKTLATQMAAQQPIVDKISTEQSLATRIEDLSTKRLLPIEMIKLLTKMRGSITFTNTVASTGMGLNTLKVDAYTQNSGDLDVFRTALQGLPAVHDVKVDHQGSRNGLTTFTLLINFNPDAVKPSAQP